MTLKYSKLNYNSCLTMGKSLSSPCKAQYLKIIWALFVHKDAESCCNKCFLANLVEAPLLAVVQLAIVQSICKTKSDHTPKVSTTRGKKVIPCLLYSILMLEVLGQLPSCSSNLSTRGRKNIGRLGSTAN